MSIRARQDAAEALIGVADGADVLRPDRLVTFGPDRAARTVLAEVARRAELFPGPGRPTTVQLDLGLGEHRLGYRFVTGPGSVEVSQGWSDDALVVLRQDLTELVGAVFGPAGRYTATREIRTKDPSGPPTMAADDPAAVRHACAVAASHQVTAALGQRPWDLTELAVRFGSDKWGSHWYTEHYDRYFTPLRDSRVKLLEIGIGGYREPGQGGASLRMWKHYFRRGIVHGLDVYDKSGVDEPRLRTHRGDQGDAAYLHRLAEEAGPFDIVIDDGSHLNEHVITSFGALFSHVRPGGLYVIEDIQTAYWPGWGGADGTAPAAAGTSMGLVKALIDGLHHQERTGGSGSPSATDLTVTAVHAHHNLVVIEKGVNTEQGAPGWIPRDTDPRTWLQPGE